MQGLTADEVDEVIMGTVLQAGQGQIPSRQAATKAGIPWSVKTETINKVCASGMRSVTLGRSVNSTWRRRSHCCGWHGIDVQCTLLFTKRTIRITYGRCTNGRRHDL